MPQTKINILTTRPIGQPLIDEAAAKGIKIQTQSFINTIPIDTAYVQQEIEQAFLQSTIVVFTSMNAVEAVANYLEDQQPDWQIYTLGQTTQSLAVKHFGEHSIAGTAGNATELAEKIVEEIEADQVLFFCGDQRRDELPTILESNDIEVQEIEVYQTIPTPIKIPSQFDGILFFSPSAVDSFFSVNKISEKTLLFAIGDTTARQIKKHSNNKTIVSDSPGKETLFKAMMEVFSTGN
ncbi:MAG: uroporphyrinogen-III synthase [Chitinophagaceae bacterium]|nr:uroporphyrinogen-III synthase [Chitinophagaceae bacterium]